MKKLQSYTPIIIQAILLLAGFIMINKGLASESNSTAKLSVLMIPDSELEESTENWMINLDSWETKKKVKKSSKENETCSSINKLLVETAFEEDIELENWMTDASNSFWAANKNLLKTDKEDEIELEDWMLDPNKWNN